MKQGWLNLLSNEKQLFSTTRNVNNSSHVRSTIKCNLKRKDHKKHVEQEVSQMKREESAVQDIEACFEEFDTKPFDDSNPELRTLQSGIITSEELKEDLKKSIATGEEQVKSYLKERVYSKELSMRDTIHKNQEN